MWYVIGYLVLGVVTIIGMLIYTAHVYDGLDLGEDFDEAVDAIYDSDREYYGRRYFLCIIIGALALIAFWPVAAFVAFKLYADRINEFIIDNEEECLDE